jgi:hypothetical protein
LHREDGPAIQFKGGAERWYLFGKVHRTNGPAVTYNDGIQEWWIQGVLQSRKQIEKRIKQLGLQPLLDSVKINSAPEPPDLLNVKVWSGDNVTNSKDEIDLGRISLGNEDDKKVLH